MLQEHTVNKELLRILKELLTFSELKEVALVGGTALALKLGHRESIDIDFFGNINFDTADFLPKLNELGNCVVLKRSKHINIFSINDIKVDFVNYRYRWIEKIEYNDDIPFASFQDIAAMKINAIVGRGSKKDFIDLYYLLKIFSIKEILGFYERKFDDGNLFLAQKSLFYFNDADQQTTPKIFEKISWKEIKNSLQNTFEKEIQ